MQRETHIIIVVYLIQRGHKDGNDGSKAILNENRTA